MGKLSLPGSILFNLDATGNMQGYEPLSFGRISAETSISDYNAGYRLLYVKDKICVCRIATQGSKG